MHPLLAAAEGGHGLLHHVIVWSAFFGAWLLVVGPLHQARVELADEELERDAFQEHFDEVGPVTTVSTWWWLLPPLRLYLGHRARQTWERELWMTLPDEQFEQLSSFMAKARGWMLVGAGGLLIATKETGELVEGYDWPTWLFWVLLVAGALACVSYTATQAAVEAGMTRARALGKNDPGTIKPPSPRSSAG